VDIASGKCLLLPGDHIIPNNLTMPSRMFSRLPQNLFFGLGAKLTLTIQADIPTTQNFCHGTPPLRAIDM